jgi:hypothetical protein
MIAKNYNGIIIVPMTLVNPKFYGEIIERLALGGIKVRHYILYAKRNEIKRRIKKRTLPVIGKDSFAMDAIDRCLESFNKYITDIKIHTDSMSAYDVVEKIAKLSNLKLLPDKKTPLGKFAYRIKISLKHIKPDFG